MVPTVHAPSVGGVKGVGRGRGGGGGRVHPGDSLPSSAGRVHAEAVSVSEGLLGAGPDAGVPNTSELCNWQVPALASIHG